MSSVALIGADKLEAELSAASRAMGNLRLALQATGRIVRERGKTLAPKRTGALAGSIAARVDYEKVSVTARAIYAPMIHWGWPAHNIEPSLFLSRAAQETEPQWVAAFAKYVDATLEKVEGIPH